MLIIKKKKISILLLIMAVCLTIFSLTAYAVESGIVQPQASEYIRSTSVVLKSEGSNGKLLSENKIGATGIVDRLGIKTLEIQTKVNGYWRKYETIINDYYKYDAATFIYDFYYYGRDEHAMLGHIEKPLPAWRLVFDDPQASWVYLDPRTGQVLGRQDRGNRASRWLFAFLHSWDWTGLLSRRPLWDALLIFLSLGGAALSLTGAVIGWRRLGKKLRA